MISNPKLVETFVNVVHRRTLKIDTRILALTEPLFMIPTHMTFEERLTLLDIALKLPEGFTAAEIGSYFGASTCFLGVSAIINQGFIHCIDTWNNEYMGTDPEQDTFNIFLSNTSHLKHFVRTYRGTSFEMRTFVPNNLDLVFLDGDHSYKWVMRDLQEYCPKIKPDGLLVMHDYRDDSEVMKSVKDYKSMNKCILSEVNLCHSLQTFKVN